MDSLIKTDQSISRVAGRPAPLVKFKIFCLSIASVTSTVLTEDFSDSDFSSCDSLDGTGEPESVGHGYCDLIDQEEDEPTFSHIDDSWGCLDDDTRRSSDGSFDDYVTGELTRCLSDHSLEGTDHEDFRVRFKDTVDVREFAITVGHQGHSPPILCPLTLDWHFSEKTLPLKTDRELRSLKSVKKLTKKQRRSWVSRVQGWSHKKVRSLEIDRVVEAMEEMMQRQESFLDGLIENGNDEGPSSDHSDSLRDWDVTVTNPRTNPRPKDPY